MLVTSEVNKHLPQKFNLLEQLVMHFIPTGFRYEELHVKMQNSAESSHNIMEEFNLDGYTHIKTWNNILLL